MISLIGFLLVIGLSISTVLLALFIWAGAHVLDAFA